MGKGRGTLHTFSGFCYKLDTMLTTTTEHMLAPAGQKLLAGERLTGGVWCSGRVKVRTLNAEGDRQRGRLQQEGQGLRGASGGWGGWESLPCEQERHPSQLSWWLFLVDTLVSPTSSPGLLTAATEQTAALLVNGFPHQATLGCRDLCLRS